MTRQNLFSDLWDGETEDDGTRRRMSRGTRPAAHIQQSEDESVLILAISEASLPDVVAYPEQGYARVATPRFRSRAPRKGQPTETVTVSQTFGMWPTQLPPRPRLLPTARDEGRLPGSSVATQTATPSTRTFLTS
jgi:hypothetical protein